MSLDFSVKGVSAEGVALLTRVDDDGKECWNDLCFSVCVSLMTLGVRSVDFKTIPEIMFRAKMAEKLTGDFFYKQTLPLEGLLLLRGLKTNVTDEKRASWLKRWVQTASREIDAEVAHERMGVTL